MELNEEFDIKLNRVRQYLDAKRLDGVYLKKRCNFAWITCGGDNRIVDHSELGWSGFLVTPDRAVLVTDNTEMPRITAEELTEFEYETFEYSWYKAELPEALEKTGGSRNIACDIAVPGFPDLQPDFDRLQYQLTDSEVERFKSLGKDTAEAFTKIGKQVELGMLETEVAGMVAFELMARNIQPQLVLVASDKRISDYRHPIPVEKKINTYVMYVAVAVKWGLNLSITRFVHFGEPSADLMNRHLALLNIDARLIHNTRPGKSFVEIFKSHRDNFAKYGYPDEWKKLHQGGSASYHIRDVKATLETPPEEIVTVNQAFAWNPSIEGIKSEDTMIVLPDSNEIISEDRNWPLIRVDVDGYIVHRPGILLKEK
jgi:Xaa-Pro dipeptidase